MTAAASAHALAELRASRLLQTYADAVDRGDTETMISLFTRDAEWTYSPDMLLRGRAEITAYCRKGVRIYKRTHHLVGPPVIGPWHEDGSFDALAYLVATHELHDGSRYTVWGRYVDRMRPEDGTLRIARRTVQAHLTRGTDRRYHLLRRLQPGGDPGGDFTPPI
jgi:ketosteroid isomerase-like protein